MLLPFDGEVVSTPEPSSLTLVESQKPAAAPEPETRLDSQNSQSANVARFPQRGLGSQNSQRAKGLPRFDSSIEHTYPSRQQERIQPRLDPNLVEKVRVECALNKPKLDLQDAVADGLRLWLQARADSRLGSQNSQTPTCSSSGGSGFENIDLTTTTTTVGSQPSSVSLPGFAAAIADLKRLPHKSRHSLETNYIYAWEMFRTDQGINKPDVFTRSNYQTGKHDALIDLWIESKREEEEAQARHAAALAAREEQQRQEVDRMREQMRIMDEKRARREAEELAQREVEEAEERACEEQRRRESAELDKRFGEGLAEGKKPWQII